MTSSSWEPEVATRTTDSSVTWSTSPRPIAEVDSLTASTVTRAVFEVTMLFVFFGLSVVGNVLVCLVIHRSRRLQSTTNYFVVSLAAADLLLATVVMPFALTQELADLGLTVSFRPPPSTCKFIRFCQLVVPTTSSFVFVAISVDRFYAVVYPLRFVVTRGRAQRLVLGIWTAALALASPAFYFYGPGDGDTGSRCEPFVTATHRRTDGAAVIYILMTTTLTFILPAAVVSAVYTKIGKYIWRLGINGRTFQRTTNPVQRAKVYDIVVADSCSLAIQDFSLRYICYIQISLAIVDPITPLHVY